MSNKLCLITGASSGIGKSCAEIFAKNGYNLIITGRRLERLNQLANELKTKYSIEVDSLCFDIRNNDEVVKAMESLPIEKREIDILINNAGLAAGKEPIFEGLLSDWEQMIDTNVKGLLYISRIIIPWMCSRKKGHIFNIASIAGKEVYQGGNVYCASKSAVDALSKAIRMDCVDYGIKVTNIAPGAVETEFSLVRFKWDKQKADSTYKGYVPLSGEDIADTIYYCASLPDHVCINDLVITPKAQASATIFHKE